MSDDGADLNMSAEGAMRAALGGPQPDPMTNEEFERRIREAVPANDLNEATYSYGACANYAARLVLEFLEAHPEAKAMPIENRWEWQHADGSALTPEEEREAWHLTDPFNNPDPKWTLIEKGLYDTMKDAGVALGDLGLTGFQWGWAANAARNILGLGSQPNPAILTIGSDA